MTGKELMELVEKILMYSVIEVNNEFTIGQFSKIY